MITSVNLAETGESDYGIYIYRRRNQDKRSHSFEFDKIEILSETYGLHISLPVGAVEKLREALAKLS